MSFGVPAGAITANHELNSKPGKPESLIVGTSGNCGNGLGVLTPIRRTLPPLINPITVASPWNAIGTSPEATPSPACVAPLYGTCMSVIPALDAKSAAAMCCGLPLPPEP